MMADTNGEGQLNSLSDIQSASPNIDDTTRIPPVQTDGDCDLQSVEASAAPPKQVVPSAQELLQTSPRNEDGSDEFVVTPEGGFEELVFSINSPRLPAPSIMESALSTGRPSRKRTLTNEKENYNSIDVEKHSNLGAPARGLSSRRILGSTVAPAQQTGSVNTPSTDAQVSQLDSAPVNVVVAVEHSNEMLTTILNRSMEVIKKEAEKDKRVAIGMLRIHQLADMATDENLVRLFKLGFAIEHFATSNWSLIRVSLFFI
jgi:hypothetical protein